MDIQGVATEEGREILLNHLENTVKYYVALGHRDPLCAELDELLAESTIVYNDITNYIVYEGEITTAYYDTNGLLTFNLPLPYEPDLGSYIYAIALISRDEGQNSLISISKTPKLAKTKGIGGSFIYKVDIDGEAGQIVFSESLELATDEQALALVRGKAVEPYQVKMLIDLLTSGLRLATDEEALNLTGGLAMEPPQVKKMLDQFGLYQFTADLGYESWDDYIYNGFYFIKAGVSNGPDTEPKHLMVLADSGGDISQIALSVPDRVFQAHIRHRHLDVWGTWVDMSQIDASKVVSGIFNASLIPNLDASKITTGTLDAGRIPNLDAGKITTGVLVADRIPNMNANKINAGAFDAARIPSLDASKISTGTFTAAQIPSLDAGKITTGTLGVDRIPAMNASKINSGAFAAAQIPNLDAGKITSGAFAAARIPNLDASKITTGTLGVDRIPAMNANKINAGTFAAAQIPNLDASKITSGTLNTARLSGTYPISVSGNAASATKLQTARKINGVSFDGTKDITFATGGASQNITVKQVQYSEELDMRCDCYEHGMNHDLCIQEGYCNCNGIEPGSGTMYYYSELQYYLPTGSSKYLVITTSGANTVNLSGRILNGGDMIASNKNTAHNGYPTYPASIASRYLYIKID